MKKHFQLSIKLNLFGLDVKIGLTVFNISFAKSFMISWENIIDTVIFIFDYLS
ncbi:hypothetical protein SAMN05216262_1289 [Colwellia chukchiensis]|uniref:Uncharacterized protein n=2 Tax=Colwelliaceae TaxID=267889 RepID=A0A7X0TSC0_9GAMM|nr:hypothetical protein [Thalassotalea piscium]SEL87243.1 hypothetical protein SAMN05216262_1289 [Colwellia chukchiensis]